MIFSSVIFNFAIAQQAIVLSDAEKQWIAEHPVIKATNEMDWPPLDFVRAGRPAGFSIDYLKLVTDKVGIKIEFVNGYRWSELMTMVRNKEIDLAHSLIATENRKKFLKFSSPYLRLATGFYGKKGSERVERIEDLINKRIGYVAGSANLEIYKKNFPELLFVKFPSTYDALINLSSGGIDLFINALPTANYIITYNLIPDVEVVGNTFYKTGSELNSLRLAVREDWPELLSILEKGMDSVTDAEYEQISKKWQSEYENAGKIGITDEERIWLADHQIIKVAVDPAIPPIEFIDEKGNIGGIAGDYIKIIEEALNVRFEWIENKNFDDGVQKFLNKEADILSAISPNDERRKDFLFTESYIDVSSMIYSREGGELYADMESLRGKKIAQVRNFDLNARLRREYPDIEIIEAENVVSALMLVSSGAADAHIGSIPITSHNIVAAGLTNLRVVGVTPFQGNISFGIRKDLPILSSAVSKVLNSLSEEEKVVINRKWLFIQTEAEPDYKLIWGITGIAIIFLVLVLIWNVALTREIKRRKEAEENLFIAREDEEIARASAEEAQLLAEEALAAAEIAQIDAEEASKAKSRFLANISHEIRTPLNVIIGFSETMIAGIFGEIQEPKYRQYLKDIKGSGEHLATVIKDILDMSKIEAGKWKLNEEAFSLDECFLGAKNMLGPQAEQKNITFVESEDDNTVGLSIYGDFHAIKRVFISILSNAVKFTPSDGEVTSKIITESDGSILITIEDDGIGIPENRLESVLNPFEQCDEANELNEEGAGLGLSIVKQLIELHGGMFYLESEVGLGTKACIRLPKNRVLELSDQEMKNIIND